MATAIVDNPVGRLLEDFIFEGGVSTEYIRWVPFDGISRKSRVGLNFTERGYGVRADGGAKIVEFTNRGDRAINVFTQLAERRDKQRPDLILGVGSICDAPTAAMYIAAGTDFVVGPLLDEDTAKLCNRRKIPYLPGCGSLTEIHQAHILGVEICKIFPGKEVGGPGFVKTIKAPCPWTEIMPTGGVEPTEESLSAWFKAGIACAGIGSNLITKELVAAGDFAGLAKKVQETLTIIRKIRQSK